MRQPRKVFENSYTQKRRVFFGYISSHTFPGRKLPNESELAKTLSMSLGTVRELLREMELTGTITKMKGKGNFLNASAQSVKMRIDITKDFSSLIEEKGYEVSFEPDIHREEMPPELLELGQKFFPGPVNGGQYLALGNSYFADGNPAIYSVFIVPGDPAGEEAGAGMFWEKYLQEFEHSVILLEVGHATGCIRERLKLPENTPIQMWNEVHFNKYDELLCCSYSYFHPEIMQMSMVRKW